MNGKARIKAEDINVSYEEVLSIAPPPIEGEASA